MERSFLTQLTVLILLLVNWSSISVHCEQILPPSITYSKQESKTKNGTTLSSSFEVKCQGSNIHSLMLVYCDTLKECEKSISCLDMGRDCVKLPSMRVDVETGKKCQGSNSTSSCFSLPFDPKVRGQHRETWRGILECTDSHFQTSLRYFQYKPEENNFFIREVDSRDSIEMTVWQPTFSFGGHSTGSDSGNNEVNANNGSVSPNSNVNVNSYDAAHVQYKANATLMVYLDFELNVLCQYDPFFFDLGQSFTSVLYTGLNTGDEIAWKTDFSFHADGSASMLGKAQRIRVSKDITRISCRAPMDSFHGEIIEKSVFVKIVEPPQNLTVPSIFSPKNGTQLRLPVEQKLGCNFTHPLEKNAEHMEILQKIHGGLRKNLIKSTIRFLQLKRKVEENYACAPLKNLQAGNFSSESLNASKSFSEGPFDFLLDFVPTVPRINKTIEGQVKDQSAGQVKFSFSNQDNGTITVNISEVESRPVLSCPYEGEPRPHIRWFQDGKELFRTFGSPDLSLNASKSYVERSLFPVDVANLLQQNLSSGKMLTKVTCLVENYKGSDSLHFVLVYSPIAAVKNSKNSTEIMSREEVEVEFSKIWTAFSKNQLNMIKQSTNKDFVYMSGGFAVVTVVATILNVAVLLAFWMQWNRRRVGGFSPGLCSFFRRLGQRSGNSRVLSSWRNSSENPNSPEARLTMEIDV